MNTDKEKSAPSALRKLLDSDPVSLAELDKLCDDWAKKKPSENDDPRSPTGTIERRSIPTYEGFYSITTEGVVYSDSRTQHGITTNTATTTEERVLTIQYKGNVPYVTLLRSGKRDVYNVEVLLKATFPENYPPVQDLEGEEWQPLPDYPEFMVSNRGRVKQTTQQKTTGSIKYMEPESLRNVITTKPPAYIVLPNSLGKVTLPNLIYRLFVDPNIRKSQKIQFKDGDTSNLSVDNLFI